MISYVHGFSLECVGWLHSVGQKAFRIIWYKILGKAALIYSERKQTVMSWAMDGRGLLQSGRRKLFHVMEIFQITIFMMAKYEYIFVKSHWIVYMQIGLFTLRFIIFLRQFIFSATLRSMQDLRFPIQGWNPCPLQWKGEAFMPGPPGKSQGILLYANYTGTCSC